MRVLRNISIDFRIDMPPFGLIIYGYIINIKGNGSQNHSSGCNKLKTD